MAIRGTLNQTLTSFLRANLTPNQAVPIIGHSLGGALTNVLAPYLHQELTPGQQLLRYWPISFAAPTVGNPTYAQWLSDAFSANGVRFHNRVDVAPHAWEEFVWMLDSFPGADEPKMPDILSGPLKGIRAALAASGSVYTHGGHGYSLNGTLVKSDDWIQEAGMQHIGATYATLLGIRMIPGTVPASAGTLP